MSTIINKIKPGDLIAFNKRMLFWKTKDDPFDGHHQRPIGRIEEQEKKNCDNFVIVLNSPAENSDPIWGYHYNIKILHKTTVGYVFIYNEHTEIKKIIPC